MPKYPESIPYRCEVLYSMLDRELKQYQEYGTSVSDVMAFMARSYPNVEVMSITEEK